MQRLVSRFTGKAHPTHFLARPWLSQTSAVVSPGARGFVSNPLPAKRFFFFFSHSSIALSARAAVKGFADLRLTRCGGNQPSRGSFNLVSTSRYNRRDQRYWFDNLSADDLVTLLIRANVIIYVLWPLADKFMKKNFTISVENFLSGRWHALITAAFSHRDMEHIISNMIGLYVFGSHLGKVFGSKFLLKLYLAGGLTGSVCYLILSAYFPSLKHRKAFVIFLGCTHFYCNDPSRTPGFVASGAVNAIILFDIILHPRIPAIFLGIYLLSRTSWVW